VSSGPAISRAGIVAAAWAADAAETATAVRPGRAAADSVVGGPDRAGRAADLAAAAADHPEDPTGRVDPVSGVVGPSPASRPGLAPM